MTYVQNTVTDRADENIRTIAAAALTKGMPETEARWMILHEIEDAGIADQVAKNAAGLDDQMRVDLRDRLADLIQTKVLLESDGGFDLRFVHNEGRSACGWARQLAKTAIRSELRPIFKRREEYLSVDPITPMNDDSETYRGFADYKFHTNTTTDVASNHDFVEDTFKSLVEQFSEAASGARSTRREHLGAKALRAAYDLPELIRPDMIEREWVKAELNSDSTLARHAAEAMLALVTAYETESNQKIDDRLLSLFDDFTIEQLSTLVEKPATVAHLIALDAVSSYPRPNRDAVEQTASLMVAVSGNDINRKSAREFRPSAKRLVDAWVASECEAVSAYNLKGRMTTNGYSDDETREFRELEDEVFEEKRFEIALTWPELAQWATELDGAPFGRTDREVSDWIRSSIGTFAGDAEFAPAGEKVAA